MNLSLPTCLEAEIISRIAAIMSSCKFIDGETVEQFENHFAEYIGVNHCIAVGNGTDAIEIVIEALGIKGAEIIVPALTAVPTAEAVLRSGNEVRFCDVDEDTLTMDPYSLRECITSCTEVIIPVHLYGQPCWMNDIVRITDNDFIWVIEDCSHAHGTTQTEYATQVDRKVGSIGDAGIFSFYPTKPLGAMGDAGCITTNDNVIAERCRRIRNHGRLGRNDFQLVGRNSRMDAIQAAVLDAKLPYLDQWNATRREIAARYQDRLDIPIQPSQTYHQLVVQVDDRDAVRAKLRAAGIDTLVHYPYIIPDLAPYSVPSPYWVDKIDWPVARHASERVLSLPMDLHITNDIIDTVAGVLNT